ncbi:MAG: type IV pilus secretin PilQ, partial [Myxococcales bacterium]|nr:type IV pilus secretin PilQ [Myxococcales bacterium]
RETALAADLAAAKQRETEASKRGQQAEIAAAAKARAAIETQRQELRTELTARQAALQAAQQEAEKNARARQTAEKEAEKLRQVVAARETALQQLAARSDASDKQIADAQTQVAAARQQLQTQVSAHDAQVAQLEKKLQGQLGQMRQELAASQARVAGLEQEKAGLEKEKAGLEKARSAASIRAEQVQQLLAERDQQLRNLQTTLRDRETSLAADLAVARQRENEAGKQGKQAEAAAAATARADIEAKQNVLRKDLAERESALHNARLEADRNAKARQQAEQESERLRQVVALREQALQGLAARSDAASQKQVSAAQSQLVSARKQLQEQIGERDAKVAELQKKLQGQLGEVKRELTLVQARVAGLEKEKAGLQRDRADADARAQAAQQRLDQREMELTAVKAAMGARERDLAQAKLRQTEAAKLGKQADAQAAARVRAEIERQQASLQQELATRQAQVAQARGEADSQAAARKLAQQELARTAEQKDQADAKAAKADAKAAKAEAERQEEAKHRQAAIQRADQAQAQAQLEAKERQAANERAGRAQAQLADRERELAVLRTTMQAQQSKLGDQLAQAKAAEELARREGRQADLDKAHREHDRLQQVQKQVATDLKAHNDALVAAQSEAKQLVQEREKAIAQANKLSKALADRERDLTALRSKKSSNKELETAQRAVQEAQQRLDGERATQVKQQAELAAAFEVRSKAMRAELERGHARELSRVQVERTEQAKVAQAKAERVESLLKDREKQLQQLQDEMRVREATLESQLDQAREREQESLAGGKSADAGKAAAERKELETALATLQGDLRARETAVKAAVEDSKRQALARSQAEAEAQRLTKALQEREEQLLVMRRDSDSAAQAQVGKVQAQVEILRQQHAGAMAARQAQVAQAAQDAETRVAKVRQELQAEQARREAALSRAYEEKLSVAQAKQAATSLEASRLSAQAQTAAAKSQKVTQLLSQREAELQSLKQQTQDRVAGLNKALEQAKKRETTALGAGHKQEAAAAQSDQRKIAKDADEARRALKDRDLALATAKRDAQEQAVARKQAERRATELGSSLVARETELEALRSDRASSVARIGSAEKAVAEAKARVTTAEKLNADQQKKTEMRVERELAAVKAQLQAEHAAREKALADQFAQREQDLQGQLAAETQRRKQAEAAADGQAGAGKLNDYLQRQQARIAVLEARAERERQDRDATAHEAQAVRAQAAEQESRIAAERGEKERLAKELDRAKAAASVAERERAAKDQADVAATERRAQQRDTESERARARQDRSARASEIPVIQDVRITAEGQRRGHVELALGEGAAAVQAEVVSREAGRVILSVRGVKLPDRLQKAYDTRALHGPMERVTVYRPEGAGDEVRVVVDLADRAADRFVIRDGTLHWDFDKADGASDDGAATAAAAVPRWASAAVKSGGDVLAAAPQPAMAAEDPEGGGAARSELGAPEGVGANPIKTPWRKTRRYTGKRINLTIKDADIQHVLTFLAKEGKVNIIAGPEVTGKITFHLENIPWDLALDVILRARGFDYVRQSGVIRVAQIDALKREFDQEIERRQKLEEVKQLVIRIIPLNYASATDLLVQVKELLSKKGTVSVDLRTNSIVIKDTEDHVAAVEEMVRKLDSQTAQVLIEARVVEASSSFTKEVGIQWGGNYAASSVYGNETGLPFPSVVGVAGGADGQGPTKDGVAIAIPNYAVNMPAAVGTGSGGAIGLTLGSLGGVGNLNLRISAAEQEGVVKIVSSPKVLTLDNAAATIKQGISIPISVVSAQGVQTRFFNADLQLRATPHITQDGNIKMDVNVTKNEPDFSNRAADGNPTITQREANTQLLLGDGETTVIGGIYTRNTSNSVKKVPFFGDIPLIGSLFRTRREEDKRTELLIFITPRIVNRSAALTVGK